MGGLELERLTFINGINLISSGLYSENDLMCTSVFNSFMPNEIFYLRFLDRTISNRRVVGPVLLLQCFTETPVFNANSLDPDQTPRSAASDLGLDCLPMSHL